MIRNLRRRGGVVFAVAWVLLSIASALWALATPIGAAPDEPAHVIKAASVVRGTLVGLRGPNGQTTVDVPQYIRFTQAQTCFAFASDVTADCSLPVPHDSNVSVKAVTTAGLYDPLYYALVGWPTLIAHDQSGIYWMRIVSGVIVSAFLALGLYLISKWKRPTFAIIGFATAVTPMVLFLGGTVNPNSLEVAATLCAFIAMLALVLDPDPAHVGRRAVILAVATSVAANMRGLSLLWLAIVLLTPLLLLRRPQLAALLRTRAIRVAIAVMAAASAAALVWLATTNSIGASIQDPSVPANAPGIGTSPLLGFIWTANQTFEYGQAIIGNFGWLDTPVPVGVYFLWAALIGGVVAGVIAIVRGRALLVTGVLLLAVLLLGPLLQAVYITKGGVIWQGRYLLPVFVCFVVCAAVMLGRSVTLPTGIARRVVIMVTAAWALAQFIAFAAGLKRYASGLDAGWQHLLTPAWTPPGGLLTLLSGYAVVAVALGALLTALAWPSRPIESDPRSNDLERGTAVMAR